MEILYIGAEYHSCSLFSGFTDLHESRSTHTEFHTVVMSTCTQKCWVSCYKKTPKFTVNAASCIKESSDKEGWRGKNKVLILHKNRAETKSFIGSPQTVTSVNHSFQEANVMSSDFLKINIIKQIVV